MTNKVLASADLELDSMTLSDFLLENVVNQKKLPLVIYVQDDEGRVFSRVSLVEETLTDGSKVVNLVLGDAS